MKSDRTTTPRPLNLRWRSAAWIVASSIALLAMSRWLSATSIEYLVLAATATAVAGAAVLAVASSQRWWAAACSVALAAALVVAATAQRELARVERDWPAERDRLERTALERLEREVAASVGQLRRIATRALAAPADRQAAFEHLVAMVSPDSDDGVVLTRGDSGAAGAAFAWTGRPHVRVDTAADGVGVTAGGTPFYLGLYAVAKDGSQRAVATRLLYAVSPADRLVGSIGGDVAHEARIAGFRFRPAADSASMGVARVVRAGDRSLFAVRAELLTDGEVRLRLIERTRLRVGIWLAVALACFIVAGWRAQRGLRARALLVGVGLACVAMTPLSAYSNYSRLFDPTLYFTSLGGPLTANAAALGLTSALALLMLLAVLRRQARLGDRRVAVAVVVLVTGLGPFLLRDLARGIQIPQYGVSASLWLIWEMPLFLAAVSVILAGASAGGVALGARRGLSPIVAPALAMVAALIAPVVWLAPAGWPWWYTFLWVAAIASLAVSRRSNAIIVSAATVAALGATTLVWGATTRARVRLAEQDVAALGRGDENARSLAARLGNALEDSPVGSRRGLLEAYAGSELAAAGYPAWLALWRGEEGPMATLATASLAAPLDSLRPLVRLAARIGVVEDTISAQQSVAHAFAIPTDSGVFTIVVAPKSLQIAADPFTQLLGIETPPGAEPPYVVQVAGLPRTTADTATRPTWEKLGNELHGDWVAASGSGLARIHAEVEIGPLFALVQRGALIALLNLGIVALLWLTSVVADGIAARWIAVRRRRVLRSYRLRLTLVLFAFFMVPAVAFAIWSYQQLSTDAARSRQLLVRETLRSVNVGSGDDAWLARESRRLGPPLFLYRASELAAASDSLLEALAPVGRRLGPEIALDMLVHGEATAHRVERVGESPTLFGYRALQLPGGVPAVLAAPARADDLALGRRARDLGILVLFATAIGALAALWLSGIAARQLARPIGSLRRAALAFAGGEREPVLEGRPTVEFLPVFAAFRRMMSELNASRTALEEATRRTATVLRNVASGVIAVDEHGVVTLANPRADELLGVALPPGTHLAEVADDLAPLVTRFLAGVNDDEAFEMPRGEQQWRGRLTRLMRGGVVITVDDVSEIARAERVLAWGEMARQVAHEIKNPLTPIRLGVQHLKRARADARVDFDRVLDKNVERILEEIDRLDEIARAFSRYGQPPEQRGGAEPTDVADVLRDLVGLETMGEDRVKWTLAGADHPVSALGRRDELRQVLLNVFENARLAGAKKVAITLGRDDGLVRVTVEDNGHGIPKDILPRIFEPHFSTRTSGSGLGLAISRRVVESWGGTMELSSVEDKGTTVRLELVAAS